MDFKRRMPVGAEVQRNGGVHFRVWAPRAQKVEVRLGVDAPTRGGAHVLDREEGGYYSGFIQGAGAGDRYWFGLDEGEKGFPDPASRFQPEGPHGPSEVINPSRFSWHDEKWQGLSARGQVIYEIHAGTWTREGTWTSAIEQLPSLAELGITVIEVMPLADFAGEFGWGYDGVNFFAPTRLYGRPDEFRSFVDRAHGLGIGVILDVVYNHFGPEGNYLKEFSTDYFSTRYGTEWGEAVNFDGESCGPVREYFLSNAAYWIDEFHLDGLRLDATQQIFDNSPVNIIAALGQRARDAAKGKPILLVAENEPQETRLVRSLETGGYGLDALWNDDLHHSAKVALTGRRDAYYTDYRGTAQEFVSALKWGYLYQGQRYKWQSKRRGTPALDLEPSAFVAYIENHDQVANSATGDRCHRLCSMSKYRAMTGLLLLGPGTPMIFQGQEFASSSPFYYFADHPPELAQLVAEGRRKFLAQFRTAGLPEMSSRLAAPHLRETFERCKLDHQERIAHEPIYRMHGDLLRLRRSDPCFKAQRRGGIDGAVLADAAFVIRFFSEDEQDRLLVVNFGCDLHLDPAPEPLLAPLAHCRWGILWSSENPSYGGYGTPELDGSENWRIPAECTVALKPIPRSDHG